MKIWGVCTENECDGQPVESLALTPTVLYALGPLLSHFIEEETEAQESKFILCERMCVSICICIECVCVCMYVCMYVVSVHMCICVCVCMQCVCLSVCLCL